jgi:hypothetical protein
MTTITLPPEVERLVVLEARRQGSTPELVAINALRRLFVPHSQSVQGPSPRTLADLLSSDIRIVDGSAEPFSENCGEWFAEGLQEKQGRGKP